MANVARFQWTDGGAQSFICDLKLQGQMFSKNVPAFRTESLDGSVVEVVTVGSFQNQVTAWIRHEAAHSGLRDLAAALRRGISMTLTPDNDTPGTTFTVTAVGDVPDPELETEGKQNLFRLGPLALRRLDGGALEPA